jgi:cyanophycin synthetase
MKEMHMNTTLNKTDIVNLNISTRLLAESALDKGYTLQYFAPSRGVDTGIIMCQKDDLEFRFKSTATSLTPSFGYFTAENKILTFNLLTGHNVPTPFTYEADMQTIPEDLDFVAKSYVVKPVAMNHGDGITIGITNKEQLKTALEYALQVSQSDTAIIQEQVYGQEYRFLVIDGKVFAVAGRQPAAVVGDGTSTILELITKLNIDPRRGEGHKASLTKINPEDVVVARGNDFLNHVPNKDEKVTVLDTSNLSKGGQAIDYTDTVSDVLKNIAVAAANACSLGVAGVDIITDDIENPTNDKSYVIEVNLAPGLRMHHFPSEGTPRDAAGEIIKALEKHAKFSLSLKQEESL